MYQYVWFKNKCWKKKSQDANIEANTNENENTNTNLMKNPGCKYRGNSGAPTPAAPAKCLLF